MPFFTKSSDGTSAVQVRATLAVMFATAIIVGFYLKLLTADSFMGIATMAISWYFAKRSEDDKKKDGTPPTA